MVRAIWNESWNICFELCVVWKSNFESVILAWWCARCNLLQNFINHSLLHHVISFNAILLYTSDSIKIQSNSDVILAIRHIRQYAFIIVTLESLWVELEFIFMDLWYSKAYLLSRNKQFSLLYTKQPYIHIKALVWF